MEMQVKKRPHLVIVGAGFGGIKAAQILAKEDIDITIVDRHNFHLFQPLLYQIATSELSENEISYPIRAFFMKRKNVHFLMAKAQGVDRDKKLLITNYGNVPYDYLLFAVGSTTNFFGIEGITKNAYGLKTLQEAIAVRNHSLHMFERANRITDRNEQAEMLTFVCVGGGPTGVEMAGALSELVYGIMAYEYHKLDFSLVRIILIEATSKVLAMLPDDLQQETIKVLRDYKVEVLLNKQVTDYDGHTLKFKDGSEIKSRTVIWAAGVKAVPLMKNLGRETDRAGRVIVDEFLRVKGDEDIFAIGDCASFMQDGRPLATVAPVATQQAAVFAANLKKIIAGGRPALKTFHYKDVGSMATICRGKAVVKMPGKNGGEMTGVIAWIAWMVVHLVRLAGFYTNITVAIKWALNFFIGVRLGRVITNMKTEETMRFLDPTVKAPSDKPEER